MSNLTYKSFNEPAILEQNQPKGLVTILANTYSVLDSVNDIVEPTFLQGTKDLNAVVFVDSHDYSTVSNILAKVLRTYSIGRNQLPESIKSKHPEASGGIVLDLKFSPKIQRSWDVYNGILENFIDKFSIGFNIKAKRHEKRVVNGKTVDVRFLEQGDLREVSAVTFPAQNAVGVLSVMSGQQSLDDKRQQLLADLEHQRFLTMNPDQKSRYLQRLKIDRMIELAKKRSYS